MEISLSTINLVIEGIISETPGSKKTKEMRANEAVIILKTALMCERHGIDRAMDYYFGPHSSDELQEFRVFTANKINRQ